MVCVKAQFCKWDYVDIRFMLRIYVLMSVRGYISEACIGRMWLNVVFI